MIATFQKVSADNNHVADSLLDLYQVETIDTVKVHLLYQISLAYQSKNDLMAYEFGQKSLSLANKIDYTMGKASAHRLLGLICLDRGEFDKGLVEMQKSADQFKLKNNIKRVAECYRNIGTIYTRKGDYDKAIEALERSIDLSGQIYDSLGIASSYMQLGIAAASISKYSISIDYFKRAYKIFDKQLELSQAILSLNNIGVVYNYQGDHIKSIEYQEKALEKSRKAKDNKTTSSILLNLGVSYDDQSNYIKAIECYDEALELKKDLGLNRGESMCYNNLGEVYKDQGDYSKAIEYYEMSLNIDKKLNDKEGQSICLANIGKIHFLEGNFEKANEYYNKSLKIAVELGNKKIEAYDLNNIGEIKFEQNKNKLAIDKFKKAYNVSSEIGDKSEKSRSVYFIGKVLIKQKKYFEAITNLKLAEQIHTELGELSLVVSDKIEIAEAFYKMNNFVNAIDYANKSFEMASEIGAKSLIKDAAELLSKIYANQKQFDKAYEFYVIFKETTDSIFTLESKKQISLVENRFELERNQKELEINKILVEKQEVEINRHLILQKTLIGGILGFIVIIVLIVYNFYKTHKAKGIISSQKDQIEETNEELNQTNEELRAVVETINQQKIHIERSKKEITDSIHYAKYIQRAILPQEENLLALIPDHFVFYKPKDIVGGDFYWTTQIEGRTIISAADCTGHGVPGGFMSMLGIAYLNDVVNKEYITHPGVILRRLRKEIIHALKQKGELGEQRDGMDIGICSIDFKNLELQYAGANTPLYIVRHVNEDPIPEVNSMVLGDYSLYEIKGDRMPIAIYEKMDRFQTIDLQLKKGDKLYMFSDGYADQFGGEFGKRLKYLTFKETILTNCNLSMLQQKGILEKAFDEWKQGYEQIDDIMVLGFTI